MDIIEAHCSKRWSPFVWQLSVEDLSSHASEFQAVKRWMTNSHALYLPNVEEPAHLAHDLASHGYNVSVLAQQLSLENLGMISLDSFMALPVFVLVYKYMVV